MSLRPQAGRELGDTISRIAPPGSLRAGADPCGGAAAITGAAGFVGRRLTRKLLAKGLFSPLHLIDIRPPPRDAFTPAEWVQLRVFVADIRNVGLVSEALRGCSACFHIASFGMSGTEMTRAKMTREINVDGTKAVLRVRA